MARPGAVRWTLSGFCVLTLAYFGSKFVLETYSAGTGADPKEIV